MSQNSFDSSDREFSDSSDQDRNRGSDGSDRDIDEEGLNHYNNSVDTLFHLDNDDTMILTEEEFDSLWDIAGSWWNIHDRINQYPETSKYRKTIKYKCKFSRKCQVGQNAKRIRTENRVQDCTVRIRVDWLKENNTVSIKRLQNNRGLHNHDMESIQNHRMSNGLRSEALSYIVQGLNLKEILRLVREKYTEPNLYLNVYNLYKKYRDDNIYGDNDARGPSTNRERAGGENVFQDTKTWLEQVWQSDDMQNTVYLGEQLIVKLINAEKDGKIYYGMVIVTSKQIETLKKYGTGICSFDATHDLMADIARGNLTLSPKVSTPMVMNSNTGKFLPCGLIVMEHEFGKIISLGLKQLKNLCKVGNTFKFYPRFWMIDPSHVEGSGINMAFPGINEGEMNPDIFWCTVHICRKWKKFNRYKELYGLFRKALYDSKTRLSFETIKADIESECLTICRRPQLGQEQKKKLKSLVKFWLDNSDYWAGYRRTYHLITQQVTTTNYNEGIHKCYKKNRPLSRRKQTNAGDAILGVITVQATQFQNNRFLVVQAENKVTPLHKLYDRFIEFPVGAQELMKNEYKLAMGKLNEGSDLYFPEPQGIQCPLQCSSNTKYLLPCKHYFFWDLFMMSDDTGMNDNEGEAYEKLLTEELWDAFLRSFEENGLNVYYTSYNPDLEDNELPQEVRQEQCIRHAFNETHDQLRNDFYHYRSFGDNAEYQNSIADSQCKLLQNFQSISGKATIFFVENELYKNENYTNYYNEKIGQCFDTQSFLALLDNIQNELENL